MAIFLYKKTSSIFMSVLKQKLLISLKNTLPTYILISLFTLLFLFPGRTMMTFSRFGDDLLAKFFFSLAFNLLYLVPQFSGVFFGLHFLKRRGTAKIDPIKAKWFLRLPAPISVVMTAILILLYFWLGFFPSDLDLKKLYILFIIVILINLLFSLVMTINIYAMLNRKIRMKGVK
ncbi:MAG: hypothetical protein ACLFNK_00685 [Candidatus Woesearchaeota archaeon]